MSPLAFVNWRSVNARFCMLMWLIVAVLAVFMLAHTGDSGASVHHAIATAARR
jgi:hypothetical protein